jgi:hypothetical protein
MRVDPVIPAVVGLPDAYVTHMADSRAHLLRAEGRTERAIERAEADIAGLDRARLTGVIDAADAALFALARAERTRERNPEAVPASATKYAQQSARGLEMGTRAVRRAAVLVANPEIGSDEQAKRAVLDALKLGQSHYSTARWLLEQVLQTPQSSTTPPPTPPAA